ncbi:MAG: N-acetylmuramoyl-L-alanine amidase, partial [Elusimicrobiota bacterium]|nr:N-acetylmuramoyl-L-alanine amidase [Elusimicrobiota bacterium]
RAAASGGGFHPLAYATTEPLRIFREVQESLRPLPITSRSAWNRRETPRFRRMTPVRLTVHHTDTDTPVGRNQSFATMRQIQSGHIGRGFDDVGYNYIIDGAGRVIEGRGGAVVGSHVEDANTGNVGISLMGNFMTRTPAAAQQLSLVRLAGYMAYTYRVDEDDDGFLLGHQQNPGASTDCPGRRVMDMLPALRERVRAQTALLAAQAADARRERRRWTPVLAVAQ